jgi:hypothetical protein
MVTIGGESRTGGGDGDRVRDRVGVSSRLGRSTGPYTGRSGSDGIGAKGGALYRFTGPSIAFGAMGSGAVTRPISYRGSPQRLCLNRPVPTGTAVTS